MRGRTEYKPAEREPFDHESAQSAHMRRRASHGLTREEIGKEFGTSKSTAHRRIVKDAAGKDVHHNDYRDD